MTRIIFFDTETSDLPKDRVTTPYESSTCWPDLVSISWMVYNGREFVKQETHIIRPAGWRIENANIHGITQEYAMTHGEDLGTVLEMFKNDAKDTWILCAHNLVFDKNVLAHAYWNRLGQDMRKWWPTSSEFCSMEESVEELKLTMNYGHKVRRKSPSLNELYENTFKEKRKPGAHQADRDVEDLAAIVWKRWDLRDERGEII